METITDPEQIRAVWEAGDMGEESLGGDSESGTYNRSNRPPAGPRPDVDNPWALLPDDHPKRPKQCGGCGTKWVDAETARACERRHGDDITTPAPVGAAVALDLDGATARAEWAQQAIGTASTAYRTVSEDVPALVAEVRRLTEENTIIDRACVRRLDQSIAWMERAEAAEAEVVTLRARLAGVEETLHDADATSEFLAASVDTHDAAMAGAVFAVTDNVRAALATTGEDQ